MEEKDLELGAWFEGGVYYFKNKSRVWVNIPPQVLECSRKALDKYKVAAFFNSGQLPKLYVPKSQAKNAIQLYKEGRNWYNVTPLIPRPILAGGSKGLSSEYENLRRIDSKVFSLASLICGSFGNDPYTDLLRKECTPIGDRIARSLVRTAATRIFNEPEQSIMELPVNSIDSYYPNRAVGKFGMGFFSILYWLIGTKRTLTIKSFCLDSKDRSYAYHVTIFFDGELKFKLKPVISYTTLTGVSIDLDGSVEKFDNIYSFSQYIKRLGYVKGVNMCEDIEKGSNPPCESKDNLIYIRIHHKGLRVEDYAKGISSDVLLTKLFIPSVSTKTIQASSSKDTIIPKQEIIHDKRRTGLSVLVNDIELKHEYYGAPVIKRDTDFIILWKLPSNTKIPVSRDDVILDEEVARVTLGELFKLAVELNLVDCLQKSLEYYSEGTSYSNSVIIAKIVAEQAQIYKHRFVPFDCDIGVFYPDAILSLDFDRSYVRTIFATILEKDPRIKYIGEVFHGKQVYLVKHGTLPSLEPFKTPFLDIILLDEKVVKDPSWKSVLSTTYFKQGKLIPAEGDPLDRKARRKVYLSIFASLMISFESTSTFRFNIERNTKDAKFIAKNLGEYSEEVFDDINAFLSNYKPKYRYAKTHLTLWREGKVGRFISLAQASPEYAKIIVNLHKDCLSIVDKQTWFWFKSINVSDFEICKFIAERVSSHLHYEYLIGFLDIESYNLANIVSRFPIINEKVMFVNPSIKTLKVLNYRNVANPFHASVKQFVSRILKKDSFAPVIYTISTVKGPTISNVDLINYVFDVSKPLSFDDLPRIDQWKPKRAIKLQTLEIAVNEGTTKSFIEAVITECFQNSLDAIRKSNIPNPWIDFSVKFYYLQMDYMVLTISDPVGMSIESFLYISIPFLSTKDNSDPAYTGEMGTGFFNVYRESSKVRILTRPPGDEKTYVWEDVPIREGGRVVDIRKTFSVTQELSSRGTTIEIHMPYSKIRPEEKRSPPIKDFADLIEIRELVEKRYRFTTFPVDIFEDGRSIRGQIEFIKRIGKVEFYYVNDDSFVSFVYTNGVPMTSPSRISDKNASRMLINILPGGYVPRQSRTFLEIAKETQKDFNVMIDLATMYMDLRSNLEQSTPYEVDASLWITSDVHNNLPNDMEVNNGYEGCIYYNFPGYGSVAKAIREGARVCDYRPDIPENMQKLKTWLDEKIDGDDEVANLLRPYILKWFSNKKTNPKEAEMNEKAVKEKTYSKTLSLLTELYVKIGKELKISGFEKPIQAIGPSGPGRSFSKSGLIVIYRASDPRVEETFYKGFDHYSIISKGTWFNIYGPVGTFTHEMEHIRRHDSTDAGDGAHTDYDKPLWPGDKVKSRDFGECQLDVYTKIVKEGRLWQRFDELLAKR